MNYKLPFPLENRYRALGIRLDSGDLAYLSKETRKIFTIVEKEFGAVGFTHVMVIASNDLNEETIEALNKQVNIIFSLSK